MHIIGMTGSNFWLRVKALIKAHNMSQRKFAEHCGFSINTFTGWIYHKRVPELSSAYVIAFALGVSLEFLLSGKDKDITELRSKQLELRKAVGRISVEIGKIQEEINQVRPL